MTDFAKLVLDADTTGLKRAKDELKGVASQAGMTAREIGSKMRMAGIGLSAGITAPLALAGGAAIKMASDFEKSMSNVATLVDTGAESMANMEAAVLGIAQRTPVAISDLTEALYNVRSAGIDAADAMNVLEGSARLGVAGLGTTAEAVDVVTSSINAFGLEGAEQARVYDILFRTVKSGKTTLSALTQGFGGTATAVANAGIELDDYMASIAALTTTGLPAAEAQTQIKAAIAGLTRETGKSRALFAALGADTFPDLVQKSGSMVNAFAAIRDELGGNEGKLIELVGSVEAYNAIVGLTGKSNEAYTTTLEGMRSGVDAVSEAFDKQNATVSANAQRTQNAMESLGISIGGILAPALSGLAELLADVANWLSSLPDPVQKFAVGLGAVTAAIGPLLYLGAPLIGIITGIGSAAASAAGLGTVGGLAALKLGLITIAPYAAAFAAVAYLVYDNWDDISGVLTDVGRGLGLLKTDFQNTTEALGGSFENLTAKAVESGQLTEDAANRIRDSLREMGQAGAVDPALTDEITELVWQMEQAGQVSGDEANKIRSNILKAWNNEDITRQKSDWEKLGEEILAFSNMMNGFVTSFDEQNARNRESARRFWADFGADLSGAWTAFENWWENVKAGSRGVVREIESMAVDAIGWVDRMVSGISNAITGRLNAIFEGAKRKIHEVNDAFFWLYDQVVGHSHVPDMVDGIAREMARLDSVMVDPARKATQSVNDAMRDMASKTHALLARLFPEVEKARQMAADLATIGASGLSEGDQFRARMRLRDEYYGGKLPVQTVPLDAPDILKVADVTKEAADKTGIQTVRIAESFKDMAQSASGAVRSMVDAIKGGDFFSILDAAVGLFSQLGGMGLFGSSIQKGLSGFGGFRANGGPVTAGKSYLVGERGPEIFSPGSSGRIIANDNMSTGGGVLRIELGEGLEAKWLQKAAGQSVEIGKAMIGPTASVASVKARRDAARPVMPGGATG